MSIDVNKINQMDRKIVKAFVIWLSKKSNSQLRGKADLWIREWKRKYGVLSPAGITADYMWKDIFEENKNIIDSVVSQRWDDGFIEKLMFDYIKRNYNEYFTNSMWRDSLKNEMGISGTEAKPYLLNVLLRIRQNEDTSRWDLTH